MLRVTVIGEGPDEHGDLRVGPDRTPLPYGKRRGCLGAIVTRLLEERDGCPSMLVRWTGVDSTGRARLRRPPSIGATLVDENSLPRLLLKLKQPPQLDPPGEPPVDVIVLSVDAELKEAFGRTWRRVLARYPELTQNVVPVVFEPELEVLLVQDKVPLERVAGLSECSTQPPSTRGDLKLALATWRNQYAPKITIDSMFQERVAHYLDIRAGGRLDSVSAFATLADGISNAAYAALIGLEAVSSHKKENGHP